MSLPFALVLVFTSALGGGDPAFAARVASEVDAALRSPHLARAQVAVAVADLDSGELLHARAVDEPLAPASNMKLLTTAAALARLGADFEFVTRFHVDGAPGLDGHVVGPLVVTGAGDPSLRADVLALDRRVDPAAALATLVREAGVTRVDGDLVLDRGPFADDFVHTDWEAADLDRAFAAPIGGLSIDANRLEVLIDGRGPTVALAAPLPGYHLESDLRAASARATWQVGAIRPDASGAVRVFGAISRDVTDRVLEVPVRDPARLFGRRLLAALRAAGVDVTGEVRLEPDAVARLDDPFEVARCATPISRAVLLANKESDNSMTDHLFKALGAHAAGVGSFESGGEAVLAFLREDVGTDVSRLRIRDGSGLSARNRVTARAVVATLVHMASTPGPERDVFLRSLPVGGLDGTLRTRMGDAATRGAVRAKTGFITGVSALSGFVRSRGGRVFAFSLLFNDIEPGTNADLKRVQDEVCRALAELG